MRELIGSVILTQDIGDKLQHSNYARSEYPDDYESRASQYLSENEILRSDENEIVRPTFSVPDLLEDGYEKNSPEIESCWNNNLSDVISVKNNRDAIHLSFNAESQGPYADEHRFQRNEIRRSKPKSGLTLLHKQRLQNINERINL